MRILCTFSVNSGEPGQLLDKLKSGLISAHGTFSGNAAYGKYSLPHPLKKIVGAYTVSDNTIEFTIVQKDIVVPCSDIKAKFKKLMGTT